LTPEASYYWGDSITVSDFGPPQRQEADGEVGEAGVQAAVGDLAADERPWDQDIWHSGVHD